MVHVRVAYARKRKSVKNHGEVKITERWANQYQSKRPQASYPLRGLDIRRKKSIAGPSLYRPPPKLENANSPALPLLFISQTTNKWGGKGENPYPLCVYPHKESLSPNNIESMSTRLTLCWNHSELGMQPRAEGVLWSVCYPYLCCVCLSSVFLVAKVRFLLLMRESTSQSGVWENTLGRHFPTATSLGLFLLLWDHPP